MVTYTSSSSYWAALKPRIKIYAFSDTTYATPLYTYDPFTDVGTTDKPVSLHFETLMTNAGTFSLEIEDADSSIDLDVFMKGNRVVIDCSKDGIVYQTAFKGLIRSSEQHIYGATGRNIVLSGYSYLIRLNERIVNMIKQSSLDSNNNYIRTDSAMFTNNLLNNLLSSDPNYVYSKNDQFLYSVLKKDNIVSSPIDNWVPRVDASLVTVDNAVQNILEFSNSVIMVDFSTDQLMIYNPDLVTSATNIFLLTNQMNQSADDADTTIYPIDTYKYNISYDFPDSGSRLIASIGSNQCAGAIETDPMLLPYSDVEWMYTTTYNQTAVACQFDVVSSPVTGLRCGMVAHGNMSGATQTTAKIYGANYDDGYTIWLDRGYTEYWFATGPYKGSITLYKDGIPGTPYPDASAADTQFILSQQGGVSGPTITGGPYIVFLTHTQTTLSASAKIGWIVKDPLAFKDVSGNGFSGYPWDYYYKDPPDYVDWGIRGAYRFDFNGAQAPPSPPCGGLPLLADADPVFAVAHDRNMSGRMGIVEKVMSSLPTHVRTLQTMNEYLFNKLYTAAKPRFTFDFPSVTMPNKMPKAGDIVTHVDKTMKVGLKTTPIQTGVISSVSYDFAQDKDSALGLRKLALTTTGIRRGYY